MHSWPGGVISTTMTTTKTDADNNNGDDDDVVDKDNNKDPNGGEHKDYNKQQPIFLKKCGQMHFWHGGGMIQPTIKQLIMRERGQWLGALGSHGREGEAQRGKMPSWQGGVDSYKDDNKDSNGDDGEDNDYLIF